MNSFLLPITLSESSLRINLLHKALKTLGFPVIELEAKSYTAGKSTLRQVRALQEKLNISFDDKYVVDQVTWEAIMNDMIPPLLVFLPPTRKMKL